jgi:hypothetical protein
LEHGYDFSEPTKNLQWVSERIDDLIAEANVHILFLTFLNDSLTLGSQTQIYYSVLHHRMETVCHIAEVLFSYMPYALKAQL